MGEAAERLGTTVDAIRKRVQRGTIPHDKAEDGRVWVLLDTDRTWQDTDRDAAGQRQDNGGELVEELRDRVAYLERQVEEEREARRRADTIIAQLSAATAEQARTIRAIEAPREPTEVAETVEEEPEAAEPRSDREGSEILQDEPTDAPGSPEQAEAVEDRGGVPPEPQAGARRPWWRRVFGG